MGWDFKNPFLNEIFAPCHDSDKRLTEFTHNFCLHFSTDKIDLPDSLDYFMVRSKIWAKSSLRSSVANVRVLHFTQMILFWSLAAKCISKVTCVSSKMLQNVIAKKVKTKKNHVLCHITNFHQFSLMKINHY